MSFPTVNGILIETDEETRRSPMAVKRGRRSGRARAMILRNDVEVEIDASVLEEKKDGRKRERMEGRVGEDWGVGDDVGARVVGLVTKKRLPCAKAYVGHGGYRLLVEGCGKVSRTESARRVPTRPRCKLSIVCDDACEPVSAERKQQSSSARDPSSGKCRPCKRGSSLRVRVRKAVQVIDVRTRVNNSRTPRTMTVGLQFSGII